MRQPVTEEATDVYAHFVGVTKIEAVAILETLRDQGFVYVGDDVPVPRELLEHWLTVGQPLFLDRKLQKRLDEIVRAVRPGAA